MNRSSLSNMELMHPTRFAKQISSIVNNLKEVNTKTEKVFLDIGNNLTDYNKKSKLISEIASTTSKSVSDSVLNYGYNNLIKIIDDLNNYFNNSINNIISDKEELLNILHAIEKVTEEIQSFKKIVKHLRVLGISTKIEIARLGTDDKGFSSLVQNVDRLSEVIELKASNINQQASYLINEILKTNTDLEKLYTEQARLSKNVLESTTISLEEFKQQYEINKEFVESTFTKTKQITSHISDVVVSIQFHDITRQQIEHVEEAFNHLLERIYGEEDNLDEVIYDICELQSEQLNHSANEFGEAVQDIITKLAAIAEDFKGISVEAENLFVSGHVNGKTHLEHVCSKLHGITEAIDKNIEIEQHLNKSINTSVNIVDDLAKFVQEIEDIGDEIEIIALNAIVKAAHVGNEGSALGILAESIQKLSIEAKEQSNTITAKLESVNAIAQSLRVSLAGLDTRDEIITKNELEKIIENILNNEFNAKQQFIDLNKNIKNIEKEIFTFASGINIHNKFLDSIYAIISEINNIIYEIHPNIKPRHERTNNEFLYKKYTMKSERDIHDRLLKKVNINKKDIKNNNNYSNNEFGDNVELF